MHSEFKKVLTYFSTGYVTAIGTLTEIIEKNSFSVWHAKEYSIMVLTNYKNEVKSYLEFQRALQLFAMKKKMKMIGKINFQINYKSTYLHKEPVCPLKLKGKSIQN